MSDYRDTNNDGKVSLMEKVKDKLHLGHKDHTSETQTTQAATQTGAHHHHHAAAVPVVPVVAAVPAAAVQSSAMHTGAMQTGAMQTGAMQTGGYAGAGVHDSRDLNRDGHVSTGEKLASATGSRAVTGARGDEEARVRLHEEQLAVGKREVGAGEFDIHKRVEQEHFQKTVPVKREEIVVERRPLTGAHDPNAQIASQDEVMRVPLHREEVVMQKRVVPTEEIVVRKKEVIDQQNVGATLRSETLETGHVSSGLNANSRAVGGAMDARDTNRDGHVSMGEKLKGGMGATQAGGAYDSRDTNRDGHVSTGEKVKGAVAPNATNQMATRG